MSKKPTEIGLSEHPETRCYGVEHLVFLPSNQVVGGSNPSGRANYIKGLCNTKLLAFSACDGFVPLTASITTRSAHSRSANGAKCSAE